MKERVVNHLTKCAEEHTVRRVQVGLVYSAVELDTGAVGVAFTFPESRDCHDPCTDGSRPLTGRKAAELVSWLGSKDLLASTLALATVNALLASGPLPEKAHYGDILDTLQIRPGDRVCMVGCFVPLLEPLNARGVSVTAVDEIPKSGSLPPEEVDKHLPRSQVAIITATSIINGTIDALLQLASSCREVALLGPSTPLVPQAFTGTPVSCLAGIRVREPERVMGSISEGQGFRVFKRYVQKVNVRLRDP